MRERGREGIVRWGPVMPQWQCSSSSLSSQGPGQAHARACQVCFFKLPGLVLEPWVSHMGSTSSVKCLITAMGCPYFSICWVLADLGTLAIQYGRSDLWVLELRTSETSRNFLSLTASKETGLARRMRGTLQENQDASFDNTNQQTYKWVILDPLPQLTHYLNVPKE